MKAIKMILYSFFVVSVVFSCSEGVKSKRIKFSGFSLECPKDWLIDTTKNVQPIDTDFGIIITDNDVKDTVKFELGIGTGINSMIKPTKTIVPIEQKKYWDSVGLSAEVVLSNRPKEETEFNIHSDEYYLKDTIGGKEVRWIFPKRFRKGRTGAYFFNAINGDDFAIYSDNISERNIDKFIKVVRSIRFNKE